MEYKKVIAEKINKFLKLDINYIEEMIEIPCSKEFGDYTFPCFKICKILKASPIDIAIDLKEKIDKIEFEKVEILGTYLNFFINKSILIKNIIDSILIKGDDYGSSKIGEGKNIIINFYFCYDSARSLVELGDFLSEISLNCFCISDIQGLVIGNSLYNMLTLLGYNCICIYHSESLQERYDTLYSIVEEELKSKKLVTSINGIKGVMLNDFNMPPLVLENAENTKTNAIYDLAATIYTKKNYDFYKNIYITSKEKKLYFNRVIAVLNLMEYEWNDCCRQVSFSNVRFSDQKLSTKKNNIDFLDNLLKELEYKTFKLVNGKTFKIQYKDNIVKKISFGALSFAFLKEERDKELFLEVDNVFKIEAESAIYLQYTYVRAKRMMENVNETINNENNKEIDYSKLNLEIEYELVKQLEQFPKIIILAIDKMEPCIVTRYIIKLANIFNEICNIYNMDILEDKNVKNARIKIIEATCQVIKNAFKLIGLDEIEENKGIV